MKKLLFGLLLLSTPAYAGTISISPWISGNDVSIAHLETQRTTIQNWANGNVEGGTNIKAGSLVSQDFATSVSIVKYRDEAFNDFTFTGHLPVTDATLTSNISAGTSYVNGVRIETSAQSHTYTASKDTYVYINAGGFFDFQEVANGAAAPSTPANDLLLAKVVTSGTAITSVTDLRTTSIQITATTSNFAADYRNQAVVARDSTTSMHVEPGQFAIGSTLYSNLADTSSKSTATGTNWIEGSSPTQANLKYYVYGYNNSGSAYDFKYSSADPVYADTSLNTGGTLQYYTSGGTTYRVLGWISNDNSGLIQTYNYSQYPSPTTKNYVYFSTGAVATGAATTPADDTIPQNNATEGVSFLSIPFKPSAVGVTITVRATVNFASNGSTQAVVYLCQDGTANALAVSAQRGDTVDKMYNASLVYSTVATSTNLITYRIRIGDSAGGTITFNGSSASRLFGGAISSAISVEESLS